MPLVAANGCEYTTPTVAGGRAVGVVIDGGARTVSVNDLLTEAFVESVTVTCGVNEPATVGVPEMRPDVGLIAKSAGRPVAEKVSAPVPPDAAIGCE